MVSDQAPTAQIRWPTAYRIIRSVFPPIDLFEDIADPSDWEALASMESKTNPRIWEQVGRLDLVPPHRRVSGPGASLLMAPFVHISMDRPGRFTDGSFGIYSAGNSEEVAVREVAYHHGKAMAASKEEPGWTSQFRALMNTINVELYDVRDRAAFHDPSSYAAPQAFAKAARAAGSYGLVYRSVRCPGGECIAIFWPNIIPVPIQGDHYDFHWDGTKVDRVRNCRTSAILAL
ncbi:MAG: RES family NAD+ phosphorylase [Bosea sp. (in: a-proteobacteria)]|uniref:RES family NAD+ phosphorylase n=1 Tax=Bosea sp. (in: a-proteobacteria) TaxID=1871050 RepID=UPI003F7B3648